MYGFCAMNSIDPHGAHQKKYTVLDGATYAIAIVWAGWNLALLAGITGPSQEREIEHFLWAYLAIHHAVCLWFGFDAWQTGVRMQVGVGPSRANLGPAGVMAMLAQSVGFLSFGFVFLIPYFISLRPKKPIAPEPVSWPFAALAAIYATLAAFCAYVALTTSGS
jgi:hypothetical protein